MTRDQIIEMSNVWLSEFGMQELRRGAEVEIELPPPSFFTLGKEVSSAQRNLFTMMLNKTLHSI